MRTRWDALAAVLVAGAAVVLSPSAGAAAPTGLHFRKAVFVDPDLAGSEGFVTYSAVSHRLVYTTHEGTTLLYRSGVEGSPTGTVAFTGNYRNQVNLWTSADTGRSWQRVNVAGTGFFTNPAVNTGFSDPDVTTDAAGTIYGSGIDLANDSLFASRDGGLTWPVGTVECHEGDRPWLAGGRAGEVFLATDSYTQGHVIVRSTDYGKSCGSTASSAEGTGFYGYGKIFLDPVNGSLYEPAIIGDGLGVVELPHAQKAFDSGSPPAFTPHLAVKKATVNTFWKAVLAIDSSGTLYLVWTSDDRKPGTTGGCDNNGAPAPNSLFLTTSTDGGHHWGAVRTVAHPGTTVLWPWVVAGSAGAINIAWYQYDRVTDLNCAPASAALHIKDAQLTGLTTGTVQQQTVDLLGRAMHYGQVCDHGTTCVATGEDRRLGEFFTLALDPRGCVMVASGDTTRSDPLTGAPLPTSRGLFTIQDRGTSLTGKDCAVASLAAAPPSVTPPATRPTPPTRTSSGHLASTGLDSALAGSGGVLLLGTLLVRRRRRREAGILQG